MSLQKRVPEPVLLLQRAESKHHAVAAAAAAEPKPKPKPKPNPSPLPTTTNVLSTTALTATSSTATISSPSKASISPTSTIVAVPSESSQAGNGSITSPPLGSSANHTGLIAGVAAGVLVVVVLIAGLLFRAKRRRGREAREAELYQQQSMLQKYSEGSSSLGYGDEGGLPLHHQQQHRHLDSQKRILTKQPDWFTKKSPLEYYRQVPPREDLKRQHGGQEDREGEHQGRGPYPLNQEPSNTSSGSWRSTVSSSGAFAQQEASLAARSLTPSNVEHVLRGESIALSSTSVGNPPGSNFSSKNSAIQPLVPGSRSYQQQQYQHPRISTQGLRRPSSPAVSPSPISPSYSSSSTNNTNSLSSFQATSPFSAGSSTIIASPSPTHQQGASSSRSFPTNGLHNYTPPPPSSRPFTPTSPSAQPSAGFYDLLDDTEPSSWSSKTGAAVASSSSAPPIPRSTRPISVASTSSFKLTSLDLQLDFSAPDVPAVPSLPRSS